MGVANGLTHAVVIGSPAVTQTANLFYQTFGKPAQPPYLPYPWLEISAFSPALSDVAALDDQVDPARTLFIIAEKEETEDVWAAFNHLYQKTAVTLGEDEAGRHFMAITDPGSVWIDTAVQHNFRHLFLNAPTSANRLPLSPTLAWFPPRWPGPIWNRCSSAPRRWRQTRKSATAAWRKPIWRPNWGRR